MSVNTIEIGLYEVQERILRISQYTMSVNIGVGTQVDSKPHNLGKAPFVDYMVSFDGGTTFVAPHEGFNTYSIDPNLHGLSIYTDKTNVYFNYTSQSTPVALSIIVIYKLFYTEATK